MPDAFTVLERAPAPEVPAGHISLLPPGVLRKILLLIEDEDDQARFDFVLASLKPSFRP